MAEDFLVIGDISPTCFSRDTTLINEEFILNLLRSNHWLLFPSVSWFLLKLYCWLAFMMPELFIVFSFHHVHAILVDALSVTSRN